MGRRLFTLMQITRVTVELEDLSQVPREFLKIDHAAIRAAIDAGERDIPGIEIFNVYEKLRAWYAPRIAQLLAAGKRSTAAEDWAAAQAEFPRWAHGEKNHAVLRNLRHEFAPPDWQRKGRRRGARNRKGITPA